MVVTPAKDERSEVRSAGGTIPEAKRSGIVTSTSSAQKILERTIPEAKRMGMMTPAKIKFHLILANLPHNQFGYLNGTNGRGFIDTMFINTIMREAGVKLCR